ncbi:MAG: hypothetical protein U1C33_05970 [Candidatus Cloacimonadaceae bacterium]|nr:hypothetical protein [Candidatus Cloacimonadaceae bacterium]
MLRYLRMPMKKYTLIIALILFCFTAHAVVFNWYSQTDSRWKNARIGSRGAASIGKSGCVVSCLSMLLNAEATNPYTTPDQLNKWLRQNAGYSNNNMRWQIPPLIDGEGSGLELVYQDNIRNNWRFLRDELAAGNKVIVKVAGRRSHWVLVVKQDGPYNQASSYIVNDPGLDSYKRRTLAYWGGFRAARSYSGNWINENAFSMDSDITVIPVQNEEFFLYDLYEIAHPADVFVTVGNKLEVNITGYFILGLFDEFDNLVETLDYDFQSIEPSSTADLIFEIEDANRIITENLQLKILYSKYFSHTPSLYDTFDLARILNPELKTASKIEDSEDL